VADVVATDELAAVSSRFRCRMQNRLHDAGASSTRTFRKGDDDPMAASTECAKAHSREATRAMEPLANEATFSSEFAAHAVRLDDVISM
jgi:hypothetical protein